jgi:hypothetical protein
MRVTAKGVAMPWGRRKPKATNDTAVSSEYLIYEQDHPEARLGDRDGARGVVIDSQEQRAEKRFGGNDSSYSGD